MSICHNGHSSFSQHVPEKSFKRKINSYWNDFTRCHLGFGNNKIPTNGANETLRCICEHVIRYSVGVVGHSWPMLLVRLYEGTLRACHFAKGTTGRSLSVISIPGKITIDQLRPQRRNILLGEGGYNWMGTRKSMQPFCLDRQRPRESEFRRNA